MRSSRAPLILAVVLLVTGAALVVSGMQDDQMSGWFAYAPLSEDPWQGPVVLTPRLLVGGAMVWVASLVVCGVWVHRRATRGSAP